MTQVRFPEGRLRKDGPDHVFTDQVEPDGRKEVDPLGNRQIQDIGILPNPADFQFFHFQPGQVRAGSPMLFAVPRSRRREKRKKEDAKEPEFHGNFSSAGTDTMERRDCTSSSRSRIGTARSGDPFSDSRRSNASI